MLTEFVRVRNEGDEVRASVGSGGDCGDLECAWGVPDGRERVSAFIAHHRAWNMVGPH